MTTITKAIEIKWTVKGVDGYGYGVDNNCYNLKTGRIIKQSYNNRSIGYWFGKKFYSVSFLRDNLIRHERPTAPF